VITFLKQNLIKCFYDFMTENQPNIRRIMSRQKSAGKKFDWPKFAENPPKNWASRLQMLKKFG